MEILCIIPARGGSKGIPHKNIIPIAGKPLIYHSIKAAQDAGLINRIIVSTDDPDIAQVSLNYGAEVIDRPKNISGDKASSESALLHVLNFLDRKDKYTPDLVVFLQATSPIRRKNCLKNAINQLINENADSLFSAYPLNGFLWRNEKKSVISYNYDFTNRPRRQDAPIDVVENGSIYIFKPWVLKTTKNRLGGKICTYLMHPFDSFQIDDPEDLMIIEQLFMLRNPGNEKLIMKPELIVFDFDGVMTDNHVIVDENGKESVIVDRGDGLGISKLKETNINILVLSTESNPVLQARCTKLKIKCEHNCENKLIRLKEIANKMNIISDNICYVGNDLNDIECLRWVGFPIAVKNAVDDVKNIARYITNNPGGHGAVREVCDLFLNNSLGE